MTPKTLFLTAFALASMLGAAAQQTDQLAAKTAKAAVKAATLFANGAELTQTASIALAKGQNEVLIEGLSPYADANSLKITASNGTVVAASEFAIDYLTEAKALTPAIKALKAQVDAKQAELDNIGIDITTNASMQGYLQSGVNKNVSGSEKGMGIDELKQTMDYYQTQAVALRRAQLALTNRQAEVSDQLDALHNQLVQQTSQGQKQSGMLKLAVTAAQAGTTAFTVKYYTTAAGWGPYYDVNVSSTDTPVEIAAKAQVWQTTGLDWDNIALTLSTSQPSDGKVAPVFETWFLSIAPPRIEMYETKAANSYNAEADMSYDMIMQDEIASAPAPTMYDYVNRVETDLDVTYNIALPYSVPGTGKPQNVDISKMSAQADYKYYTAPKLDATVYLLAEIADWQKLGLLSGQANITYAGTYLGTTQIDASSTQDKLTLTLGTESRISVKREKIDDFSAKKTLGSNIEQTFTYKITVRNNLNRSVKLTVKDQYPRTTQKNIVVTLAKETTAATSNNDQTGVLTWDITSLAPGANDTFQTSYTVRYPKEMQLDL